MSRSGNYVNNRDIEFATSISHNVSTRKGRIGEVQALGDLQFGSHGARIRRFRGRTFWDKGGKSVSSQLLWLVLLMLLWGESVKDGKPSIVGGWNNGMKKEGC